MIHKGPTVEVPRSLLEVLLRECRFNGDLANPDHAERGADFVIAFSEATQILEKDLTAA